MQSHSTHRRIFFFFLESRASFYHFFKDCFSLQPFLSVSFPFFLSSSFAFSPCFLAFGTVAYRWLMLPPGLDAKDPCTDRGAHGSSCTISLSLSLSQSRTYTCTHFPLKQRKATKLTHGPTDCSFTCECVLLHLRSCLPSAFSSTSPLSLLSVPLSFS